MLEIIKIESKRILSKEKILLFLVIVFLLSVCSTYVSLQQFVVYSADGTVVTWQENLANAKKNLRGKNLDKNLIAAVRQWENLVYVDETSLDEIVRMNYEGKKVQELTDEEIDGFYQIRLSRIRAMLEENQYIQYTQEEKEHFLDEAGKISEIPFEYAEGWKALNKDMEMFVSVLLIVISVLLLPLFGTDPKVSMNELYRSCKFGKVSLDTARILAAFIVGTILYVLGVILFFVITIAPFGLEGGTQYIQSNATTFFSLYNITYVQQYFINAAIGFIALLFSVSLLLLITAVMEKIMVSAVILVIFWVLLLLFDQMYLWQVNHYFANFMPLRMTSFSHYFIGNEIYRIFGFSLSCMTWSILLSSLLAGIILLSAIGWEKVKRKKGLY